MTRATAPDFVLREDRPGDQSRPFSNPRHLENTGKPVTGKAVLGLQPEPVPVDPIPANPQRLKAPQRAKFPPFHRRKHVEIEIAAGILANTDHRFVRFFANGFRQRVGLRGAAGRDAIAESHPIHEIRILSRRSRFIVNIAGFRTDGCPAAEYPAQRDTAGGIDEITGLDGCLFISGTQHDMLDRSIIGRGLDQLGVETDFDVSGFGEHPRHLGRHRVGFESYAEPLVGIQPAPAQCIAVSDTAVDSGIAPWFARTVELLRPASSDEGWLRGEAVIEFRGKPRSTDAGFPGIDAAAGARATEQRSFFDKQHTEPTASRGKSRSESPTPAAEDHQIIFF